MNWYRRLGWLPKRLADRWFPEPCWIRTFLIRWAVGMWNWKWSRDLEAAIFYQGDWRHYRGIASTDPRLGMHPMLVASVGEDCLHRDAVLPSDGGGQDRNLGAGG